MTERRHPGTARQKGFCLSEAAATENWFRLKGSTNHDSKRRLPQPQVSFFAGVINTGVLPLVSLLMNIPLTPLVHTL
jgi:hypothetical protein